MSAAVPISQSPWGWTPPRDDGIWRYCPGWARPLVYAAPWLGFALLLVQFAFVHNRLYTDQPGVVCDLPQAPLRENATPECVALVLPFAQEGANDDVLVFFDDERHILSDAASTESLAHRLAARVKAGRTLLLLADRRVSAGALMRLVNLARGAGIARVQIGERAN